MHILSVNDDFLACVVQRLNWNDSLNFSQVCTRFHNVWKRTLPDLPLKIGTNMKTVRKEIEIFMKFGKQLKNIKINNENLNAYLLSQHKEKNINFLYGKIGSIMCEVAALEHLRVEMPYIDRSPAARFLQKIATGIVDSPNLKKLTIDAGALSILSQLHQLQHVKVLNGPLGFREFKNLCNNNRNLLSLEFDAGDHSFELSILKNTCKKLKILKLGGSNIKDFNMLAELPNLKKLVITLGSASTLVPFFNVLNSKSFTTLDHLELLFPINNVTIVHIAEIIKLKTLKIPYVNDCLAIGLLAKLTNLEVLETCIQTFEDTTGILQILKFCTILRILTINVPSTTTFIFNLISEIFGILFVVRNLKEQEKLQLQIIFDCDSKVAENVNFVISSEWSAYYSPFLSVKVYGK